MKVLGIVAEYNPFHNGHAYHITESKRITGADTVVAIMSGNFLQRGEPAIFDKWTRAQMAMQNGVDLVLELPAVYATQNAERFAYGAVASLHATGLINYLSFGSESGHIEDLFDLADFIFIENSDFQTRLNLHLSSGLNYPSAYALALDETYLGRNSQGTDIMQANNTLGLMYLKALKKLKSPTQASTVKRQGSDYHQRDISSPDIASATAIRDIYLRQNPEQIRNYIPGNNFDLISNNYKTGLSWEDFWQIIFAKIHSLSPDELRAYPDVKEGLENRIKSAIIEANSVEDLIRLIKSKRYTQSRIQRILTQILLDIKKTDLESELEPKYLRLLAFNKKGQDFLNLAKKTASLPLIANFSAEDELDRHAKFDIHASRLYSLAEIKKRKKSLLGYASLAARDFRQAPLRYK